MATKRITTEVSVSTARLAEELFRDGNWSHDAIYTEYSNTFNIDFEDGNDEDESDYEEKVETMDDFRQMLMNAGVEIYDIRVEDTSEEF